MSVQFCFLNDQQTLFAESAESMTMAMTALVKSLMEEEHSITEEAINSIDIRSVVEDIKGEINNYMF